MRDWLILLSGFVSCFMAYGFTEYGMWTQMFVCMAWLVATIIVQEILIRRDDEMSIDIDEFLDQFEENYEFLYNAKDNVAGYDEAVDFGDEFIEKNPEFVAEFCKYRGDALTSDREVASFAFTLDDMGMI